MLRVRKAQANNISLTLSESTTLNPVYYFLELRSNQDRNIKRVLLGADISDNPVRYNEFILTESDTEDLQNAIVTLNGVTYDFSIWESGSNSFDDAVNEIEKGKLEVIQDATESNTYESSITEYTYKAE